MKKKTKQPLLHKTHLPLYLLGAAMTLVIYMGFALSVLPVMAVIGMMASIKAPSPNSGTMNMVTPEASV